MISLNIYYLLKALSPNKIALGVRASTYELEGRQLNQQHPEKAKNYCSFVNKKEVERQSILNYVAIILQSAEGSDRQTFLTKPCEENTEETEMCMNAEQEYKHGA